jgi:hypothetical protein
MNRHERRRVASRARHNKLVEDYVQHLPAAPLNAPLERGRVYDMVCYHDDWCGIYDKPFGTLTDCNCSPTFARHVEPERA